MTTERLYIKKRKRKNNKNKNLKRKGPFRLLRHPGEKEKGDKGDKRDK